MFELKLWKISGRSLDISTKGSMVCHRQKKHHTILEECEKSLGYHQNEPPVLIYVWNEVLEESVEGVQIAVPKMQRYATIKRNITPSSKNAEEFGISSKWATSFDLCLKWSFGRIGERSSDISTKDAKVCHHQKKHHTILEEWEKSLGYHQNEPPVLIYVWNEVLEESVEGVQIAVPKEMNPSNETPQIWSVSLHCRPWRMPWVWNIKILVSTTYLIIFGTAVLEKLHPYKNTWKRLSHQYQQKWNCQMSTTHWMKSWNNAW